MTDFVVGEDEDALRSSLKDNWIRRGGLLGATLCLILTLTASQSEVSLTREVPDSSQTIAFSQVAACRVKTILSSRGLFSEERGQVFPDRTDAVCGGGFPVPVSDDTYVAPSSDELARLLSDTPMQSLLQSLNRYAPKTRAMAVGIAKQESDWGRQSPRKNGEDCFNYFGYKGVGKNGSVGGYACFSSPDEATEVVVGRIESLMQRGLSTPQKMLVWKCGSSCSNHDPKSVARWVSVVSRYYDELSQG